MMAMLHRGNAWGSLGVGVPYYKATYEFFRWWSWLLVGGLENGDGLLNGPDVPGEVPIPLAHNALVRAFLETDHDTLLIVEDDHVGDQDVVRRMRTKPENRDFDIVCASYMNRRGAPMAVGCALDQVNEYGEWNCILDPMAVARTGTQEHDVAALGLVMIRRGVLMEMLGDQDPEGFFWFDWRGRNSQDIQFYAKARAIGARVGVDRDNAIGHIATVVRTMDDYYRWREAAQQGGKNDG